jgi:hypothetical protein
MNTKCLAVVCSTVLLSLLSEARTGLDVQFHYQVVDEQGTPISEVKMVMGFSGPVDENDAWKGQKYSDVQGVTDRNGRWTVSGMTLSRPAVSAKKEGYYSSGIAYQLIERDKAAGRWKPYERSEKIVLRKIVNPIPMYAWGMHLMSYPVGTNIWVGYDMLLAEWMPPHGKGEVEDVRLHVLRATAAYDRTQPAVVLTILFMGEQNGVCGINDQTVSNQSWLKLPYCAPREGYSEKEFRFEKRFGEHEFKTMTNTGTTNCFFRIRSKIDKDGKFVEGLHGKIHGPVGVEGGKHIPICMIYYVNPTPNDLNMEFDPKKNLVPKKEAKTAVVMP